MSGTTGVGGHSFDPKLWQLVDLDKNEVYEGQFIAEDVSKRVGATLAVESSPGRQDPVVQWVSGREDRFSFRARLWANHVEESIEDRIEKLEQLARRQDDLKRPPVCLLLVASIPSLSAEVLVESIGGVRYDEPRPDGSARGATFQISVVKFVEVTLVATDPTKPPTETRIRRARQGDTYESIAADEYGDPELGILLRQRNPKTAGMDLTELSPGDGVHIFSKATLLSTPIEPKYHGLRSGPDNEAAEASRRALIERRSADGYSTEFASTSPAER